MIRNENKKYKKNKQEIINFVSSQVTITTDIDGEQLEGTNNICGKRFPSWEPIGSRIHLQQAPVELPVTTTSPSFEDAILVISCDGIPVQTTKGSLKDIQSKRLVMG